MDNSREGNELPPWTGDRPAAERLTGRSNSGRTTELKETVRCYKTTAYPSISLLPPKINTLEPDKSLIHPMILRLFQKPPYVPLAGRLKYFLQNWEKITKDPKILNVIKGWKIPQISYPQQRREPKPLPLSDHEKLIVDQEVNEMLGKGAIIPCYPTNHQFLSNIFFHLKPIMQQGKIKALGPLPMNSILVTADVVGLYPSIPHKEV